MYKCRNCGHTFDESELNIRYERHNDYYTESINACPVCKSGEVEICVYCKCCEDEFFRDELNSKGICKNCVKNFIDSSISDIDTCCKIGDKTKIVVELNSFLYDFFGGVEDIEKHLLEYIRGIGEFAPQDFSKYLEEADEDVISKMILDKIY